MKNELVGGGNQTPNFLNFHKFIHFPTFPNSTFSIFIHYGRTKMYEPFILHKVGI